MIPFMDLKIQYKSIKHEVDPAIQEVLESCQFSLGVKVAAFEEQFASYCGVSHAVAVNSGTSALHLALLAAGVGPGDEVITVPFTFVATVAAIGYTGARAVFVDIDPQSFTIDVSAIESVVTAKTKAIVPVHLYGQPADMAPIQQIARRHGLVIIEDAAQAHGAEYHGQRAGSLGDMGCFSFYPGKNLGAYGEGGIVTTNNAVHAHTIRMLRDWGAEHKYEHILKGYNYRMEAIQGAVLGVKLRHLEAWTEGRRTVAAQYNRHLAGSGVVMPTAMAYARHVYHVYAIRTPDRQAWQSALQAKGIQTGIHYPFPIHLLPAYSDLGYGRGQFPEAEKAAAEVLSLPIFPELSDIQCEAVATAVKKLSLSNETVHPT